MARIRPDAALWDRLAGARDRAGFVSAWLALQCNQVGEVASAVVVMRPDLRSDSLERLAVYPEGTQPADGLLALAERCVEEQRGQVEETQGTLTVAFPLVHEGRLEGVVAMRTVGGEGRTERVLAQLQWGAGWLLARQASERVAEGAGSDSLRREVLACLRAAREATEPGEAARAVVTRLAAALGCDRVSYGLRGSGDAEAVAVSHMAIEPGAMNLVRSIEAVMDEAADQGRSLVVPGPQESPPPVTLESERHRKEHDVASLCAIPVAGEDGEILAVITAERGSGRPLAGIELSVLHEVAQAVVPLIDLRRREERTLVSKALDHTKRGLRRLLGPGYLGRKVFTLSALVLVVLAWTVTTTFRVTADGTLEGDSLRSVSAPVDGFIASAERRAGDRVEAGETLATLDDRDLRLQLLAHRSERDQISLQLQERQARGERAEASVLAAQLEQVDAQIGLLETQIDRTRIRAPLAGHVVDGDLSQSLGSAVDRGDRLFTIAPLEGYRFVLEVDERDIDHVRVGQEGEVLLAPLPEERFRFRVERLTSVTVARDGSNHFEVEAVLLSADPRLRPGMQGVGKVEVGEARLVWVWTRRFIDWWRLTLWQLGT